jgi:predicted transcriptional regulator
MKSVLIELDEPTYRALNHVAPAAKRVRAQFIRDAIRKAIREAEYERIRLAYQAYPDSEAEADDWSTAEEYKP